MSLSLDRIDFQILQLLQKDGRMSNKELAAEVGLAPSSCHARVRRLLDEGAVTRFRADIPADVRGIGLEALCSMRLQVHRWEAMKAFREHLASLQEVLTVFHLAGDLDFMAHLAVRDAQHLRQFVMEHVASRPEIDKVETRLVYESVASQRLPFYRADAPSS